MKENFSVAVIAKNEQDTLPRLVESVKGVDDIVILDTGSTDDTVKIAKELGCNVIEAGDRFIETPTQKDIDTFKERYGFEPTFTTESKLFNYSAARNYALTFTKNDMVFQPDADEIVKWDLEKVKELIPTCDQLNYRFCFAHKPDGTCGLEFMHTKFFRKSKLMWHKKVHEIHVPCPGVVPKEPLYTDIIYLEHWQKPSANRTNYLSKLEYAILEKENDDRNTYYLGREYFYNQQWEKAIKVLQKAIDIGWWKPELGQAYIEMGLSYQSLGEDAKAEECFMKSIEMNDRRREPFWHMGALMEKIKDPNRAITYYEAAMTVPFNPQGYLNHTELYGFQIPDKLTFLYSSLGRKDEAKRYWLQSMKLNPPKEVILTGLKYFYGDLPKIAIIVPTCRPEGFERLERSIKEHTVYPNYEIIKKDQEGTAVEKFNQGVEETDAPLVVFIADDCEVKPGWLEWAFITLKDKLDGRGLVIFNDKHWEGTLANHFLVSKDMRDELDGDIWCPEYYHCSVDVELYWRLRKKNLLTYEPNAEIIHHHHHCHSREGAIPNAKDEWYNKIEGWTLHDRLLLIPRLFRMGHTDIAHMYSDWFYDLCKYPKVHYSYDMRRILMPIFIRDLDVLNVGIGEGNSGIAQQLPYFHFRSLTHLDVHKPYIDKARDIKWKADKVEFIESDIKDFKDFGRFNTVLMFDVLEHLPKEDSINVIKEIHKYPGTSIIIFIPLEDHFRDNTFGADSQDHKSLWTEEDFIEMGFNTEVLKDFHRDETGSWDALWAIKTV